MTAALARQEQKDEGGPDPEMAATDGIPAHRLTSFCGYL
jgi:hypothetical protein